MACSSHNLSNMPHALLCHSEVKLNATRGISSVTCIQRSQFMHACSSAGQREKSEESEGEEREREELKGSRVTGRR